LISLPQPVLPLLLGLILSLCSGFASAIISSRTDTSLNGLSATAPVAMNAEGEAQSTTHSAISGGQVNITDDTAQQAKTGQSAEQTLASLHRDTGNTQNSLTPIFNEQEIRAGFEITQTFSQQVGTFLENRAKESTRAQQELQAERAKPEAEQDPARIEALTQTLNENATWEMGGTGRIVLNAVTAAASGNVSGSGNQLIQAVAANYLQSLAAQEIKKIADSLDSETARTALQALNACVGAAAQGASCGAAALGASAAVVINNLLDQSNGKAGALLSAEEKEARRNLVTSLITGVTALTEGDTSAANNAAATESENNSLIKGAKIVLKTTKAAIDSYKKNGKVKVADLKQTLKDEGLDIIDNLLTLADGELTVDDALAIVDLAVGTEFNKANKGEALKKIAEIERKYGKGYEPNAGGVANMGEFLKSPGFGSSVADASRKTNFQYNGNTVYKASTNIGEIKKGDVFYLDKAHNNNHMEVFTPSGEVRAVLNLDGTPNKDKTDAAKASGRRYKP